MKRATAYRNSRTDPARVRQLTDATTVKDGEAPEWTTAMFARAVARKGLLSLRIDAEVIKWFKARCPDISRAWTHCCGPTWKPTSEITASRRLEVLAVELDLLHAVPFIDLEAVSQAHARAPADIVGLGGAADVAEQDGVERLAAGGCT